MKVLIFGARGFIGSALQHNLSQHYEVYGTTRSAELNPNEFQVNLLESETIRAVLTEVKPEVIINCAGVIDKSDDVTLNEKYTRTMLQAVVDTKSIVREIIIAGSAAEYGNVLETELPVSEEVPLRAPNDSYGASKAAEEHTALEFREKYNLPVTVLRIFNIIGKGMGKKFLVSNLKAQLDEYQAGIRKTLEVNRKDSRRDYVAIDDLTDAIRALVEKGAKHSVYNIGSGTSTTSEELLHLFIENSKLDHSPPVIETSQDPEPLVAVQADISRLQEDTGWKPVRIIADTIKEIMNVQTSN